MGKQHDIVFGFVGRKLVVVPRQQGMVVVVHGTFDEADPAMVLLMVVSVSKTVTAHTFAPLEKVLIN